MTEDNVIYGLEMSSKEASDRIEDLEWFLKRFNAYAISPSADGKSVIIIFEKEDELKTAYETAISRYKTVCGKYAMIKIREER